MKPLAVAATVAFWAAASLSAAVAQQASPSAKLDREEIQERKSMDLPKSSVGPTRPMEETPLKYDLPPAKLAYVERTREELEAFRQDIERYRAQLPPGSERTEVDDMVREWHRLKEQWQWLKQTRAEDWETAREQFERLFSDIREEWREVRRPT